MAQDYVDDLYSTGTIGDTTLSNMEKNFAALKSAFSGSSAPSNPVAGMWWFDTSAHILKIRNEANNAWLSVWDLANNKPIASNLVSADFGAALKDPAAGTAGLRTLGTGAQQALPGNAVLTPPDGSVTTAKLADYAVTLKKQGVIAGDDLVISNATERNSTSATYSKMKEVTVGHYGTLRIKFDMKCGGGWTAYGKVYRNGVAVGTERSSASTSYLTYSEDISGWSPGDLCQVYGHVNGGSEGVSIRNLNIYSDGKAPVSYAANGDY
jgi:hypothetical protein